MVSAHSPNRRQFLSGLAAATVILPQKLWAVPLNGEGPSDAPKWLNAPHRWKLESSSLVCTADPKTDFWRKTFYGYITDNGHFYYRMVRGDFTVQVKVSGQYHDLYDQAGLMVRIDSENWMKCGVEFVEGE